jgi:hypothetical protein
MRRRAVSLLLLSLGWSGLARAADPPARTMGVGARAGQLTVSVGLPDLIPPSYGQRLQSGFATRVLIRIGLVRADSGVLVAQTFRHAEIVYDLWDEKFRVRIETGAPPEQRSAASGREALDLGTNLVMFPVADLGRLEPGAVYRLRLVADLNPLSPDVVAEVRRWLVRPPGQGRLAPGATFFGSFVSIFVNPKIEESERRLEIWSQAFRGSGR